MLAAQQLGRRKGFVERERAGHRDHQPPLPREGDQVAAGDTIATIEAMKMEAGITAPQAGTVSRVAIGGVQQVEGGDLLVVLR